MTPLRKLHGLLCQIFDGPSLRRFVAHGPDADKLLPELPGETADLAELAHALIDAARRHGLLDEAFLLRLGAERPRWADEINALRPFFPVNDSEVSEPLGSGFQLRLVFGRFKMVIMLGVAALFVTSVLHLCRMASQPSPMFGTTDGPIVAASTEQIAYERASISSGSPAVAPPADEVSSQADLLLPEAKTPTTREIQSRPSSRKLRETRFIPIGLCAFQIVGDLRTVSRISQQLTTGYLRKRLEIDCSSGISTRSASGSILAMLRRAAGPGATMRIHNEDEGLRVRIEQFSERLEN